MPEELSLSLWGVDKALALLLLHGVQLAELSFASLCFALVGDGGDAGLVREKLLLVLRVPS